MAVRRIVPNIAMRDRAAADAFYRDALGLDLLMDLGWIATYGTPGTASAQISVASEDTSGLPVPDLSIEVDDLDAVLGRLRGAGFELVYGPADEPWGVRRAFVRDPFGKLVNILSHSPGAATPG